MVSIFVAEESSHTDVLTVVVPSAITTPRITESDRVCSQAMVEDEPLYQEYHEVMLSNVKHKSLCKSE